MSVASASMVPGPVVRAFVQNVGAAEATRVVVELADAARVHDRVELGTVPPGRTQPVLLRPFADFADSLVVRADPDGLVPDRNRANNAAPVVDGGGVPADAGSDTPAASAAAVLAAVALSFVLRRKAVRP